MASATAADSELTSPSSAPSSRGPRTVQAVAENPANNTQQQQQRKLSPQLSPPSSSHPQEPLLQKQRSPQQGQQQSPQPVQQQQEQEQQHPVYHQHEPFPSSTSSFSFRNSTMSSLLGPSGYYNNRLSIQGSGITEGADIQQDRPFATSSLYTIDRQTPIPTPDEQAEPPDTSYFGRTGEDYLLKLRRARIAQWLCVSDLVLLVGLTTATVVYRLERAEWEFVWSMVPVNLVILGLVRIMFLAGCAYYGQGNYNAGVIVVCGTSTLYFFYELNRIIQTHVVLAPVLVAEYFISFAFTQAHWICYSTHTPFSAALEFEYDPLLHENIRFTRESRLFDNYPTRPSTLQRGTSYGTMFPCETVQEQDEDGEENDRAGSSSFGYRNRDYDMEDESANEGDHFIKVDVGSRNLKNKGRQNNVNTPRSRLVVDRNNSIDDLVGAEHGQDEDEDSEEQDMAVLLAFQDARQQQVFAFSPTASSSAMPQQPVLMASSLSSSAKDSRSPLSLAFQRQDSSRLGSYDVRTGGHDKGLNPLGGGSMASSSSGAHRMTLGGGAARKRTLLRSPADMNSIGRRTWTGGRSIIYSGILIESSDDSDNGEENANEETAVAAVESASVGEDGIPLENSHVDAADKDGMQGGAITEDDEQQEHDTSHTTTTDETGESATGSQPRRRLLAGPQSGDDGYGESREGYYNPLPETTDVGEDVDETTETATDDVVEAAVGADRPRGNYDVELEAQGLKVVLGDDEKHGFNVEGEVSALQNPGLDIDIGARGDAVENSGDIESGINSTDNDKGTVRPGSGSGGLTIGTRPGRSNPQTGTFKNSRPGGTVKGSTSPDTIKGGRQPGADIEKDIFDIESGNGGRPIGTISSTTSQDMGHGHKMIRVNVHEDKEIAIVVCEDSDCDDETHKDGIDRNTLPDEVTQDSVFKGLKGKIIHLDLDKHSDTKAVEIIDGQQRTLNGLPSDIDAILEGAGPSPASFSEVKVDPKKVGGTLAGIAGSKPQAGEESESGGRRIHVGVHEQIKDTLIVEEEEDIESRPGGMVVDPRLTTIKGRPTPHGSGVLVQGTGEIIIGPDGRRRRRAGGMVETIEYGEIDNSSSSSRSSDEGGFAIEIERRPQIRPPIRDIQRPPPPGFVISEGPGGYPQRPPMKPDYVRPEIKIPIPQPQPQWRPRPQPAPQPQPQFRPQPRPKPIALRPPPPIQIAPPVRPQIRPPVRPQIRPPTAPTIAPPVRPTVARPPPPIISPPNRGILRNDSGFTVNKPSPVGIVSPPQPGTWRESPSPPSEYESYDGVVPVGGNVMVNEQGGYYSHAGPGVGPGLVVPQQGFYEDTVYSDFNSVTDDGHIHYDGHVGAGLGTEVSSRYYSDVNSRVDYQDYQHQQFTNQRIAAPHEDDNRPIRARDLPDDDGMMVFSTRHVSSQDRDFTAPDFQHVEQSQPMYVDEDMDDYYVETHQQSPGGGLGGYNDMMVVESYADTTKSQFRRREAQPLPNIAMHFSDLMAQPSAPTGSVRFALPPPSFAPSTQSTVNARAMPSAPSESRVMMLSTGSPPNRGDPPTLNFPRPPQNPPPVKLLANRGFMATGHISNSSSGGPSGNRGMGGAGRNGGARRENRQSLPRQIQNVSKNYISRSMRKSGDYDRDAGKENEMVDMTAGQIGNNNVTATRQALLDQIQERSLPSSLSNLPLNHFPMRKLDGKQTPSPPRSPSGVTNNNNKSASPSLLSRSLSAAAASPVSSPGMPGIDLRQGSIASARQLAEAGAMAAALAASVTSNNVIMGPMMASPPSADSTPISPVDGRPMAIPRSRVRRHSTKKQQANGLRTKQLEPGSRKHLHPKALQDGIMASWNNEFDEAMDDFEPYKNSFPRWALAAAEIHIIRQLISGQLSEADVDLTNALQLSEKVSLKVLDKKTELEANFLQYRTLCAADLSLATFNDATLRQNYKWDCELAFYDTLLYKGILQITSVSDAKSTFGDIKGGLQLRRAWKGYQRIRQEIEAAQAKFTKLQEALNKLEETKKEQQQLVSAAETGGIEMERSRTQEDLVASGGATSSIPINVPIPPAESPVSESPRWSVFGRRGSSSWNPISASTSPPAESSRFLSRKSGHPPVSSSAAVAKNLATTLRDQAKLVEESKVAVQVLEDTEDFLRFGVGLFYFIMSIVPKSFLPVLKTIGFQADHEQGVSSLEWVISRKNSRAPFAGLFLLINYLFLTRGMMSPEPSLNRAGEILKYCLSTFPNSSSFLLLASHHARKTGNMIPSALNHITRGIQSCEAAGIPSINYRFEMGLTFFIHQEFGKAADIFEILWQKYIFAQQTTNTAAAAAAADGSGVGGQQVVPVGGARRRGRRSSSGQQSFHRRKQTDGAPEGSSFEEQRYQQQQQQQQQLIEEEVEEDEFELAPFCGLCLIASKQVIRLSQVDYFAYGRDGFGNNNNNAATGRTAMERKNSSASTASESSFQQKGKGTAPVPVPARKQTTPIVSIEFDLMTAIHEVMAMMMDPDQVIPPPAVSHPPPSPSVVANRSDYVPTAFANLGRTATMNSATAAGAATSTAPASSSTFITPPPSAGKLNRFNKFTWTQCQKAIDRNSVSPFLPLVILYLRRDVAYMKPVLLRKYRTLLETVWKTIPQPADADSQAIYFLLNGVLHRQLLPDDSTVAYTSFTDCLLLESAIMTEWWVIPYCHYELGELFYKKLDLPQEALEQFYWILKGPGRSPRSGSLYGSSANTTVSSLSNPRLSIFGGASESAAPADQGSTSTTSQHQQQRSSILSSNRYSQMFFASAVTPAPATTAPATPTTTTGAVSQQPFQTPYAFYNSRYKKFEFSQVLRHRCTVAIEQIQKVAAARAKATLNAKESTVAAAAAAAVPKVDEKSTVKNTKSQVVVTATPKATVVIKPTIAVKQEIFPSPVDEFTMTTVQDLAAAPSQETSMAPMEGITVEPLMAPLATMEVQENATTTLETHLRTPTIVTTSTHSTLNKRPRSDLDLGSKRLKSDPDQSVSDEDEDESKEAEEDVRQLLLKTTESEPSTGEEQQVQEVQVTTLMENRNEHDQEKEGESSTFQHDQESSTGTSASTSTLNTTVTTTATVSTNSLVMMDIDSSVSGHKLNELSEMATVEERQLQEQETSTKEALDVEESAETIEIVVVQGPL